jgi:glycosyltransferase involved in cell wall biosynthesis
LFPHRAWEEMAAGIERYLQDPGFAKAMGRALRSRALEMLDPARLDRHEREQYARLLDHPGSPSARL